MQLLSFFQVLHSRNPQIFADSNGSRATTNQSTRSIHNTLKAFIEHCGDLKFLKLTCVKIIYITVKETKRTIAVSVSNISLI